MCGNYLEPVATESFDRQSLSESNFKKPASALFEAADELDRDDSTYATDLFTLSYMAVCFTRSLLTSRIRPTHWGHKVCCHCVSSLGLSERWSFHPFISTMVGRTSRVLGYYEFLLPTDKWEAKRMRMGKANKPHKLV